MPSVRLPRRRRCPVVAASYLPIPPSLRVEALLLADEGLTILASSEATEAPCPLCGERSDRVHSRYTRTLADPSWADVAVRFRVRVRKFFCANPACPRAVFAERLAGVAQAYARRTDRQQTTLTAIAFALGGDAGARLALRLGMPVSPDTVIARDRAGVYAEGARDGAPDAVQVADRWHLVDNLADALEALLRGKGTCLKAAAAALATPASGDDRPRPPPDEMHQGKRRRPQPARWRERMAAAAEAGVARRRANFDRVGSLRAAGMAVAEIARTVGVSRMTVYKYLREGPPQRRGHTAHGRQRLLEPYEPYLLTRWNEGCHTATVLWREIRAQGFAHSVSNVHRFVAELRREGPPPTGQPRTPLTKPQGPSARHVAALLLRRPERRSDEEHAYLKHLSAEDPTIAAAVELAEDFLLMLRRREGDRLPPWLDEAAASGIDELARLAATLRNDLAAVQAGMTLRHSNGQTEGQVGRLKLVKRQGYGRAKVDLLRKRVLRVA